MDDFGIFLVVLMPVVYADPPSYAPAYGCHDKHDKHHHKHDDDDDERDAYRRGYQDGLYDSADYRSSPYSPYYGGNKRSTAYHDPYGIQQGRYNRDAIGGMIGGIAGGMIGDHVCGDTTGQIVGAVAGTILGAVIGNEIGQGMGDRDRACIGSALSIANDRHSVRWRNPTYNTDYRVPPCELGNKIIIIAVNSRWSIPRKNTTRNPETLLVSETKHGSFNIEPYLIWLLLDFEDMLIFAFCQP